MVYIKERSKECKKLTGRSLIEEMAAWLLLKAHIVSVIKKDGHGLCGQRLAVSHSDADAAPRPFSALVNGPLVLSFSSSQKSTGNAFTKRPAISPLTRIIDANSDVFAKDLQVQKMPASRVQGQIHE